MESAKQKVSNIASAAKEKIHIAKAKAEEGAEQATVRTKEGKEIAKEVRKVKEAEAKAELHGDKARHAAKKLEAKQAGHHIPGMGVVTGTGQHIPVTTGHQTFGGAGNIPPSSATHTHPQPYNKHI
ncbi:Late embryogenesis abundant protein 6 [Bienertia sinuspersici]